MRIKNTHAVNDIFIDPRYRKRFQKYQIPLQLYNSVTILFREQEHDIMGAGVLSFTYFLFVFYLVALSVSRLRNVDGGWKE
jgi:hypothetical protein